MERGQNDGHRGDAVHDPPGEVKEFEVLAKQV